MVSVNPGTVFGPGDLHFNAGSYIRAIARGGVFFYPEGGTNCVHVEAVVQGHMAAFERGRPGERYILGGENLTYRAMFETIAEVLGKPRPRIKIPYPLSMTVAFFAETLSALLAIRSRLSPEAVRAGRYRLFYSNAKARRELDLPEIPFRKAIVDAVRWYREKGLL